MIALTMAFGLLMLPLGLHLAWICANPFLTMFVFLIGSMATASGAASYLLNVWIDRGVVVLANPDSDENHVANGAAPA